MSAFKGIRELALNVLGWSWDTVGRLALFDIRSGARFMVCCLFYPIIRKDIVYKFFEYLKRDGE